MAMIQVNNLSLRYGKRVLFDEVNLKFTQGNCYGIIGANGAGKSTFLKILSGEIDSTTGKIDITPGARMSVLKQDHGEYDEIPALEAVIRGNEKLWRIMEEKDAIYAKEDFSDEDGMRVSELEHEFSEMNGWEAESEASQFLSNLGVKEEYHNKQLKDLEGNVKVRILLAQALFGNPDILLLDEPTNDLDLNTITWLEDFLAEYENLVLVVSHDRHFLDQVCTHVADIDFGKINIFTGNYSFWYQASQLASKQRADKNKKLEDKAAELKDFIARFSANASKSKQATSRKKALEKLNFEDIKPSNRKYPAILWKQEREAGDIILEVNDLSAKDSEGNFLFQNLSFEVNKGDKISVIADDHLAVTALFDILTGKTTAHSGEFRFGQTIKHALLPIDNSEFFETPMTLIDWLRQFSEQEKDEQFIRGYLGKMLFSGEEVNKMCNVLSGGEKMRCMIARMMLQSPNFIMLDEPTNHLDLESITAFNESLKDFPGTALFSSYDHEFTNSCANRVLDLLPNSYEDKLMSFDDYLVWKKNK